MRVRYTRRALKDLYDIGTYIRDRNPLAASEIEVAIRSTIELLADYPKLGRDRPELGGRALGVTTALKRAISWWPISATTGEPSPRLRIWEAPDREAFRPAIFELQATRGRAKLTLTST